MFKKYLVLFEKKEFTFNVYKSFTNNEWVSFLNTFESIFRKINKNMFQWYFNLGNTFGILKNINNKCIGIYGLLDIQLKLNTSKVNSYLCHNVGISKEFSGKGLFQYLGEQILSNKLTAGNIALGFPNKLSKKGHLRLGWEHISDVEFIKFNSSGLSKSNKEFEYDFILINEFSNSINQVLSSANNQFSLNVNKDNNYLNWRISKPESEYQIYSVLKDSVLQGYCIFKEYQELSEKRLHLVDYNFINFDVLDNIIEFSVKKYLNGNYSFINTWIVKNTCVEERFKLLNFIRQDDMPSYPIILFQKNNNYNFAEIDKRKIFFTLFDNDVF